MCQLPNDLESSVLISKLQISKLQIPEETIPNPKKSRNKFWEIQNRYHCAAIGTCLTLKELRQIAKKAKIDEIETFSDYELHVSFITVLDSKCYVSLQVNKLLDKKYKRDITQFSKTKSDSDRIQLWHKALEKGEVAGAFWALLTHPDTTENILFQVYGKIHMLSHLSGASVRINMKEFHELKNQNQSLKEQQKSNMVLMNKKLKKRDNKLNLLTKELQKVRQEKNKLIQAKEELEDIKRKPIIKTLEHQLRRAKKDFEQLTNRNHSIQTSLEEWKLRSLQIEKENQILKQQAVESNLERQSLERRLTEIGEEHYVSNDHCSSCLNTNPDLCGRCVLYVGGRNGQCSNFRQLVEQQNGKFFHHDGGLEDGHQKLESIVCKADVVVCPLDCISHTAVNTVKRHCKKNTKQLVFIPHASLSAFAKGLTNVSNHHQELTE